MNLIQTLEAHVNQTPNKTFLSYNNTTYTYLEFSRISSKAAAYYKQKGIQKGDRIALMNYNTPAFIISLIAAWKIGASVVPINHKIKPLILDYLLEDSQAKFLLFDAALYETVQHLQGKIPFASTEQEIEGVPYFDTAIEACDGINGSIPDEGDTAEILYTSGTTGKPKGCIMSHKSIALTAQYIAITTSMTPFDRMLIGMPIWHSSPLNNWFGSTLFVGGTIYLLREYHPVHFLEEVQNKKISIYFGAPISFTLPLRTVRNFDDYDLSSIRAWIYGGNPISPTVAQELMDRYKTTQFYQGFGMTETGPVGSVLYPHEQVAKAGSIGRLSMPGVDMKVVDDAGNQIKTGEIGEIFFKTSAIMDGYLNKEEESKKVIDENGWYKTGDLARIDEDGYLFIVDRKKDMIINGGENVYSKQVEDVLLTHPTIVDAAVYGVPHPDWGETVVASIICNELQIPKPVEIQEYLRAYLADYEIPRQIHFTDELPRNPSGKVQKYILKEAHAKKLQK